MVRYRRNFVPGGTWFFTVNLANRHATTLVDHISALRAAFRQTRAITPFTIEAIVVLPNHLHAILTLPPDDSDFPARWRRIKSLFSQSVAAATSLTPDRNGAYAIWQKRYWEHTIRDDTDFARHVDYIHNNPVKHGHVTHPLDWPHSSLHHHIKTGRLPPQPPWPE